MKKRHTNARLHVHAVEEDDGKGHGTDSSDGKRIAGTLLRSDGPEKES
jgi:hypothetical protein